MTSVVRFRTGDGQFAVRVDHVREVRSTAGLQPMPSSRPDVVGLLALGDQAVTVIARLGAGRDQVLVLEAGGTTFGLLVEEVTGVVSVEDHRFGPPPAGQEGDVVSGVVALADGLVLIVDPATLARDLRGG
jgi:chemotaxis signal transduction protein